jgi:hypothetical protein
VALVVANRPINIVNPPVWYGNIDVTTSTEMIVSNADNMAVYRGVGLQYAGPMVTGGTFNYFAQYDAVGLQLELSEFSVSAPIAFSLVSSNNLRDVFSLILGGNDKVIGSLWNDYIAGYGGDDLLYGRSGSNYIDGGAGIDTALYDGSINAYQIARASGGFQVRSTQVNDTLISVERIGFEDATLAFDYISAQAYRLYQAAFARTPDTGGLSHWVKEMDQGTSIHSVASNFLGSAEFQHMYGASPAAQDFVALLYLNVLGRSPDQAGYDYWLGNMASGESRESVLVAFSESAENRANVAADIAGGIVLTPDVWG